MKGMDLIMNIAGLVVSLQGAVSQGILWGIMTLGVYITYKILNIADLTVDGSFSLGGCVCAVLISAGGWNPLLAVIAGMCAGILAGLVTGILHTVFEIPAILAGILTQLSLWSINLRVMGKSNTSLGKLDNVFSLFSDITGLPSNWTMILLGFVFAAVVIFLVYCFFGTELGAALRATGDNPEMISALGCNIKVTKTIALSLSNGLVGLSGALICQQQKYADIGMGTGAIVIGLAAIVIGEVIFSKGKSFYSKLISAVVGSIIYFIIRAVVLRLGIIDANDMKLFTAVLVVIALSIPFLLNKYRMNKEYVQDGGGQ